MTYEQQLQQLETLIKQLENGDLSLDQALAAYEQRIRLLTQDDSGAETLIHFTDPADDDQP